MSEKPDPRHPELTQAIVAEARTKPGGWIYVVDPHFDPMGEVPPEGVAGAWKVNPEGIIDDAFLPNPRYRPSPRALGWRAPQTKLEQLTQLAAAGFAADGALVGEFAVSEVWIYDNGKNEVHVAQLEDGSAGIFAFSDEQLLTATGWAQARAILGLELAELAPPASSIYLNSGTEAFARIDPEHVQTKSQAVLDPALDPSAPTEFEKLMIAARSDPGAAATVLDSIWTETFFLPSGTDATHDARAFTPVLYPGEHTMMAVFTSLQRITSDIAKLAPFSITMTGANLLTGLQPGAGLVVNPGSDVGMELLPDAVSAIRSRHGG